MWLLGLCAWTKNKASPHHRRLAQGCCFPPVCLSSTLLRAKIPQPLEIFQGLPPTLFHCFWEKWCHPHLSLKNSVGKINKPTQRIKQEKQKPPPSKWMKKFTPITLLWSSSFHASWFRNYKIFFFFCFFEGSGWLSSIFNIIGKSAHCAYIRK